MRFSCIIWDFNGTIVNDAPISLDIINDVLSKRNIKKLSDIEAYKNAFCFPIKKYYENIGLDFTKEPYEVPAGEWVSGYRAGIKSIPLSDGIHEVLEKIKKMGYRQIVLSASEKEMLCSQLDFYNITKYFDAILGTDDVYGGGKIELAREYLKSSGEDLHESLFIGDTDHDFETAKILGCKCILYSGGHMSHKHLKAFGVPVIDNMNELLKYL